MSSSTTTGRQTQKRKRVVLKPASKRTRAKLNQPVSKGSKQTVPADIHHVHEGYTDKDECAKIPEFSPRLNVGSTLNVGRCPVSGKYD